MFSYSQSSGVLTQNSAPMLEGDKCYSGTGDGRNNPAMQGVKNVGPIPQGRYRIGMAFDDPKMGPIVMALLPLPGTDTLGRDGFFMHGDNKEDDASHGCLVAPPAVRYAVDASRDRILEVTS